MKKIVVLLLLSFVLIGCSDISNTENGVKSSSNQINQEKKELKYETLIEDNLYYFPNEPGTKEIAEYYELFIKENPELKIVEVVQDFSKFTDKTKVIGYFIFTEENN